MISQWGFMRLCKECLSIYKRSHDGKKAKKEKVCWGRGFCPQWIYHNESTAKCLKHHGKSLADSAAYRANKINATPKWANRNEIKKVYIHAFNLTKLTGVRHEVDHIVPLNGVNVKGLHVHWNLQAIPASVNRLKSNRFKG